MFFFKSYHPKQGDKVTKTHEVIENEVELNKHYTEKEQKKNNKKTGFKETEENN